MDRLVQTQTDDGLMLAGVLNDTPQKDAIVVYIHGMQNDFFSKLEPYRVGFPAKGVAFLAGETHGSYLAKWFPTPNGNKVTGGAYERFEDCVQDIKAWVDLAEREGYNNIWLAAHSLGPAKIAYYMHTTNDQRVKGLIFLSPSDNVGLVKDPEGAADHAICYPEAQKLYAEGNGTQFLSHMLWGDKVLSADTYLNLFSDDSASNVFHYYDPAREWDVVNGIRVPVIAFTGTNDDGINPVMEPQAAMKLLEQQLKNSSKVQAVVFDNAEHSFQDFEQQIIDTSCDFMTSQRVG